MRSNARPGLCRRLAALADVRVHECDAIVGGQATDAIEQLRFGKVRVRVTDRGEHLVLAVGIPVEQRDVGRGLGFVGREDARDEVGGVVAGLREVRRPRLAPVGAVDAHEERRDDLAELLEHQLGVQAGFGQRVGAHAEQQRFVGLAGAVDADVGDRGGGQDAAHRVARLRLDRLLVDEVGVVRLLRVPLARPIHHPGQQRVVRVEQPVEVGDVPHAERRLAHLRRAGVPVAAVDA